ncbi:MAG TPA: hypothetical protein VF265_10565, partial [Nevskiaceae bacterium]
PQAHYWSKQGASLDDANSALAQCKYEVGLHHVTDQDKQKSLVQECMQGKGFQWETRQSSY